MADDPESVLNRLNTEDLRDVTRLIEDKFVNAIHPPALALSILKRESLANFTGFRVAEIADQVIQRVEMQVNWFRVEAARRGVR
jgi:hypothetical protein